MVLHALVGDPHHKGRGYGKNAQKVIVKKYDYFFVRFWI